MPKAADFRILHIGPGRYHLEDRDNVTYRIWRELASGFGDYHVICRSEGQRAEWTDGNLRITLIRSHIKREAEFLATQFALVPMMIRERPDVIVCQSPVLGGIAAVAAARWTGARVLSELHGAEFFVGASFGSRDWLLRKLTHFVLNQSTLIRVLSSAMRDQLGSVYGANLLPRTRVLPPRVDVGQFRDGPTKAGEAHKLRLAMVGAVNPNKGQLRLIRSLEDAPFEIELHVIGAGIDLREVRRESARLASGASNLKVVAHGSVPHSAVSRLLRECDVFVMYSLSEGTPRAMMEAMAVGLAVISTNVGFCADVFEHGEEGFLLGDRPDEEIIGMLERFRTDPTLARRLGAAAQARACHDYDSIKLFESYRRLIEETACQ